MTRNTESKVRFVRPVALSASLALVMAAAGAGGSAALAQPPHHSLLASPAAAGASRSVVLVTGNRAVVTAGGSEHGAILSSPGGAPSGPMMGFGIGGHEYEVPAVAVPYLGRGLGLALFDVRALAASEAGGKLPVQVDYRGRVPALPGVTITSATSGSARGYLTARSATAFGAALARQFAADHRRGSYGTDGIFGGGVFLTLAGSARPSAGPAARPDHQTDTLTVTGTNLAGHADTGDVVSVTNVDNQQLASAVQKTFHKGAAKFSVPAGHYFVTATYLDVKKGKITGMRADILPQVTVSRDTTVHTAERAASSKITMITPRPATQQFASFWLKRTSVIEEGNILFQWFDTTGPIWVSPTTRRPTVGTLEAITNATLTSNTKSGTPYDYWLAYRSDGTIPSQRRVVSQSSLATVDQNFYSQKSTPGFQDNFSLFPGEFAAFQGVLKVMLPQRRVEYVTASPALAWRPVLQSATVGYRYGQGGPAQAYRPGEHRTESLDAYPLHSASYDGTWNYGWAFKPVSASRNGNQLTVAVNPFTDSAPGDVGETLTTDPVTGEKVSATYQFDVNGVKVAGGNAANDEAAWQATVSPKPSVIRFTLDTAESSPAVPRLLSYRSQTSWTWKSAHEAGRLLPPAWACTSMLITFSSAHHRDCAVQPLLTLAYSVGGMSLHGVTRPGPQVVRVRVGHLPLTRTAKVTTATVSVSFDGGKTWKPATVTGTNGSYQAAFTAPGPPRRDT